ncbi:MAG: RluA family pseudouridine synthase [Candidatus Uhrbacteria bacterium]|nr:RluA family pseudouridine synthase [Candidatus Uhrbacteria bacterium]
MNPSWIVTEADHKKRLDVFLSENMEDCSRSHAKKLVEQGDILVNGKNVSGHHFLKTNDEITMASEEHKREQEAKAKPHVSIRRATKVASKNEIQPLKDLKIIKETADWIVVYKPRGVLMHPDHKTPKGTLVDAVIAHAPQVAKIGDDPSRPGIMSRLDKDVSGLVVIAKTQDAFDHLKHQFSQHSVSKTYKALVYGTMKVDEGDIRFRIGRSNSKARMAAFPEKSEHGQAAWTHYRVEERLPDATLLEIQILTGRTHQIRAHLYALNHPVVGDALYKPKSVIRQIQSDRLLLQSVALSFTDPTTGEQESFEIPLDKDISKTVEMLRALKEDN